MKIVLGAFLAVLVSFGSISKAAALDLECTTRGTILTVTYERDGKTYFYPGSGRSDGYSAIIHFFGPSVPFTIAKQACQSVVKKHLKKTICPPKGLPYANTIKMRGLSRLFVVDGPELMEGRDKFNFRGLCK